MEETIAKLPYYVITNATHTIFLCHGEDSMYGRTDNIHKASKLWPKQKADETLKELREENLITEFVDKMFIYITYSIKV